MKFAALALLMATSAFPQSAGATSQQAKDCAQNFIGNNNTGTVTCTGVDKKLTDLIGQLVSASKRDGKTLKNISDKLEALLKELQNQTPTISITSFNQQGGITAGQVNINPPIRRLQLLPDQEDAVAVAMASFEGQSINVQVRTITSDSHAFGQALVRALGRARMKATGGDGDNIYGGCPPPGGISFEIGKDRRDAAEALGGVLIRLGIVDRPVPSCTWESDELVVMIRPW